MYTCSLGTSRKISRLSDTGVLDVVCRLIRHMLGTLGFVTTLANTFVRTVIQMQRVLYQLTSWRNGHLRGVFVCVCLSLAAVNLLPPCRLYVSNFARDFLNKIYMEPVLTLPNSICNKVPIMAQTRVSVQQLFNR